MVRSELALVIPAFNESQMIATVVTETQKFGDPLVVDDCSSDNTGDIAKKAGAIVVRHTKNKGYDASLNDGFKEAIARDATIIITCDSDGQHDPRDIKRFTDSIIAREADVVVGLRPKRVNISDTINATPRNIPTPA